VQAQAEAAQAAVLDAMFGSYLRGDSHAYRGTFAVADNYPLSQNLAGEPPPDGAVIPRGAGLASLVVSGGVATLSLHNDGQYIPFTEAQANPLLVVIGVILGDNAVGGDTATCTGCLPDLFSAPESISLAKLVPTGFDADIAGGDPNLKLAASGTLDVAAPCSLAFADLLELAPGVPKFEAEGKLEVWHVSGDIGSQGQNGCETMQSYTIDLYVDPTNLADYGTKNFVAGMTDMACPG
jgi:hypothetical protein